MAEQPKIEVHILGEGDAGRVEAWVLPAGAGVSTDLDHQATLVDAQVVAQFTVQEGSEVAVVLIPPESQPDTQAFVPSGDITFNGTVWPILQGGLPSAEDKS